MSFGHIVEQVKHQDLRHDNTLHVIGVIQNGARYHSRYRLFRQWLKKMQATQGVKVHVVESVFADRVAECDVDTNPNDGIYNYTRVHSRSEIWQKENLINLAVRYSLPRDWRYMAWVDCDVNFRNKLWAVNTIHQLQHFQVVQPWSDAVDLSFDGGVLQHFKSCGYYSAKHIPQAPSAQNPYKLPYGHVGFAWACTRHYYENIGKLLDFAILGAGDNHMAWSCLGKVDGTYNEAISQGYKDACLDFQRRAHYASGGIIGYTPGRLEHWFHGSKRRRGYWDRWQILVRHKYDPLKDLAYTNEGVIRLKGKHKLEQDIRLYNRNRMEDATTND